jgi:hypothetical protein
MAQNVFSVGGLQQQGGMRARANPNNNPFDLNAANQHALLRSAATLPTALQRNEALMQLTGRSPGAQAPAPAPQQNQAYAPQQNRAYAQTGYALPGGASNIQSSITPGNIYSNKDTRQAVNQAVASQAQGMSLPWLTSQYARPGMAVDSAGVQALALPDIAKAQSGAAGAQVGIPFQDTLANATHQLAGQTARENESIDWARLLSGLSSVNQGFQTGQGNAMASVLASLLG